jgi:flagellar protein FliL
MAAAAKKNSVKESGVAEPSIVVAFAVMAVIAGGAGASFAFMLPPPKHSVAAQPLPREPATEPEKTTVRANRFPDDAIELALDPIVTSIGADAKTKMRLEASLIVTKDALALSSLKKELTEDIVAFLNGITVEDISGARGFQNLDDRAKIRGRGMVLGLLISGFVVE